MLWNFEFRTLGEVIMIDWCGSCLVRENSCSPTNNNRKENNNESFLDLRMLCMLSSYAYVCMLVLSVYVNFTAVVFIVLFSCCLALRRLMCISGNLYFYGLKGITLSKTYMCRFLNGFYI